MLISTKTCKMDLKECKRDITDILLNSDFSVLRTLRLTCHEFRMKVGSKLEYATTSATERLKENKANSEKILRLQQEVEALKSSVDSTKLQQKIIDKKISNAMKKEDTLKKEIEDAQTHRVSLSLELVDLQQEIEDKKKQQKLKWDAVKRACHGYKQNLDMDIQLEEWGETDDYEKIKVVYFVRNEALEGKYYVNLLHKNGAWKVGEIQPTLDDKHMNDLKNILSLSGQPVVTDITAFLCRLRHIFLKYYVKSR